MKAVAALVHMNLSGDVWTGRLITHKIVTLWPGVTNPYTSKFFP